MKKTSLPFLFGFSFKPNEWNIVIICNLHHSKHLFTQLDYSSASKEQVQRALFTQLFTHLLIKTDFGLLFILQAKLTSSRTHVSSQSIDPN